MQDTIKPGAEEENPQRPVLCHNEAYRGLIQYCKCLKFEKEQKERTSETMRILPSFCAPSEHGHINETARKLQSTPPYPKPA